MLASLSNQDITRFAILSVFLLVAIVGFIILTVRKKCRNYVVTGDVGNSNLTSVVFSALFITLGILPPMIFHIIGGQSLGRMLLPMHIPVLLAGFVLSSGYAFLVGALTPFLSSIITGMPPLFPMMYIMIFELGIYGLTASLLYRWLKRYEQLRPLKLHIILSLIGAMILGRVTAGLAVWSLIGIHGAIHKTPFMVGPFAYTVGSVSAGIVGIVIQIIVIPAVIIVLEPIIYRNANESRTT